jgi:hypothetical protein
VNSPFEKTKNEKVMIALEDAAQKKAERPGKHPS